MQLVFFCEDELLHAVSYVGYALMQTLSSCGHVLKQMFCPVRGCPGSGTGKSSEWIPAHLPRFTYRRRCNDDDDDDGGEFLSLYSSFVHT